MKGWSLVFYGTKYAVDKNDVVSVPLMALNTSSTSTNQPIPNTTKSTNNSIKGNRKQQQSQHPKTAQTSPPNGRKNGKINGKSDARKNWKQRLTTARPHSTAAKDRKFDNGNGIAVTNRTLTTTARPVKLPGNNVDPKNTDKLVYVKAPIKAPKQIKEAVAGSSAPNATIAPPFAYGTRRSNDSTTASPYDAQFEFIDSFPYTSNPNLPKFLERYEGRIQEFYPEFHPYVVPKAASSGAAMKPLRDGSKNTHFALTSVQHQSSAEDDRPSMGGPASKAQSATVIASKHGKG